MSHHRDACLGTVCLIVSVLTMVQAPGATASSTRVAVDVDAGANHSCVLTRTGSVVCTTPRGVERFPRLPHIAAVTSGGMHVCVLTDDGDVFCWGDNLSGQLGDGTQRPRDHPVRVVDLGPPAVGIDAGYQGTCALLRNGHVRCWGRGPLGDGSNRFSTTPVRVRRLEDVAQVSVGGGHACALSGAGGVWCWGENPRGQIGDGSLHDALVPTRVRGLPRGIGAVTAGGGHTCALTTGGSVMCWGYNGAGQLGDGTWQTRRLLPVEVIGLSEPVAAISAGAGFTCVATEGGAVSCWGNDYAGGLGDGAFVDRNVPAPVVGLVSGVTGVAAGSLHACARLANGGIRCWGSNDEGELGDGTTFTRPVPVSMRGFLGRGAPRGRPDALLARSESGPWLGEDIVERRPDVQTLRARLASGERRSFWIEIQNDADHLDRFFLEGSGGTREIRVSYGKGPGSVALGQRWVELGAHTAMRIPIVAQVAEDAAEGASLAVSVRVRSASDCTRVDTVRAVLVVG